jgi:hypothetical protein
MAGNSNQQEATMPPKSESSGERIVDKNFLIGLIKESKVTKERTSSIAGSFGERIKSAVDNGNLDRKAFAIVAGIYKMGDELRRKEVIRNVDLYLDMCEEAGLFGSEHMGDIAEQAERAAAEAKEAAAKQEADQVSSNVVALTKGISKLEEDHDEAVDAGADAMPPKKARKGDALASLAAEPVH